MYTATDAVKSLEVYFKIHTLEDYSLHLEKNKFENNLKVDVVALHRKTDTVLSTAKIGYLTNRLKINNPLIITLKRCKVEKIVLLWR